MSRPSPGSAPQTGRARRATRAKSHSRFDSGASSKDTADERVRGSRVSGPSNTQAASSRAFGPGSPSLPLARSRSWCSHVHASRSSASQSSGDGASACMTIRMNARTVTRRAVPSRSKNSTLELHDPWSSSTRAGMVGTNETARKRIRSAADCHRPAARWSATDHAGRAMRSRTRAEDVIGSKRPGASRSRTGPSSRFGSTTSTAANASGEACAHAAVTGEIPDRVFPAPVSPSSRKWRSRISRKTAPEGGNSARHCGTASPGVPVDGTAPCRSGRPTESTSRKTRAKPAEIQYSMTKSVR